MSDSSTSTNPPATREDLCPVLRKLCGAGRPDVVKCDLVSERIRQLRTGFGLSQHGLRKRANLTQKALSSIEGGSRRMPGIYRATLLVAERLVRALSSASREAGQYMPLNRVAEHLLVPQSLGTAPKLPVIIRMEVDGYDASGRGCVFRYTDSETGEQEIYLRIRVTNTSDTIYLSQVLAYLYRIRYSPDGRAWEIISDDPHPLNWGFSHGQPRSISPGGFTHADLVRIGSGSDSIDIMIARTASSWIYWQEYLSRAGYYEFSVELAAPGIAPVRGKYQYEWKGAFDRYTPGDFRDCGSDPL